MVRAILIILAMVAPFTMPWAYAVLLGLIASYFFPPTALVMGTLFEVLYGQGTVPYAFFIGAVIFTLMLGVRRFVKTRIMDA
ncbi:MAG TPA: hypothetical protein VEA92_01305 [Candidatus Paceibacterota bacterium]|nr:hypothetical protein [Candidatus Paceibacterota bacterium]